MQVLSSGQAGLFAVKTATGYTVERLDTCERHQADARDIAYYFAGCNDVDVFTAHSEVEARRRTEMAWSGTRAVRLFIILLDPNEGPEDLVEVGEALDELLVQAGVTELTEYQVFSAPLPQPIAVQSVRSALATAPLTLALLERFLALQAPIARVRAAFDQIDDAVFENSRSRERFFESAVDRGGFRALVQAAASSKNVDAALFQLYSDLKGLENHRVVIGEWTKSFDRVHHHYALEAEPDEQPDDVSAWVGAAGRGAYERALQQQVAIVERIRLADFVTARRFAREMVAEQQRSSSPEHIAKSLSRISQKARQLEVIDLALEWAQEAVEIKSDDALAHAQLGDLLMRIGRYQEAGRSLDLAQSYGEAVSAASGRARILRYQGLYTEALEAYQRLVDELEPDDPRGHFAMAGVAECHRELEEYDLALAGYNKALERYPYNSALHSGRAATLVDLASYDEALYGYHDALGLDDDNVVPRNGIATLYRRAGKFDEAESLYLEIIADYPFDTHAHGGLVGTLRELGRFNEAVEVARRLVAKLPSSADAKWILADALIDARQFDEAIAAIETAVGENRHVAGLRTSFARIERAKGNYAAALAIYDDASRDFPSNAWIQVGRADMLRRLGNVDEALRIYERALNKSPRRLSLKNAVASIYIHEQRLEEALALLTIDEPRNADEWRNFALRGMLDSARGDRAAATVRFERGIQSCPFRRERNILRASLARLQLEEGGYSAAIETSQECADDVTELMKFHANALLPDKRPARELYERLRNSYLPEPYHELRDEIAANFNVVTLKPKRDLSWVLAREADALLLEAA